MGEDEEMWVRFACAAIAGHEIPDDFESDDTEDLANEIADVAEAVADVMLEAFKERFAEKRGARRSRPGGKGRRARGGGSEAPAAQD